MTTENNTCECSICNEEVSISIKCTDCNKSVCNGCITLINDDYVCTECKNENYYYCDSCNTCIHSEDSFYAEDASYCVSCYDAKYHTCDCCDEVCRIDSSYNTCNDDIICQGCYRRHYFTCNDCGDIHHIDNINSNDNGCYCENCISNHESDTEIHDLDEHSKLLELNGANAITDYHPEVDWQFLSCLKLDTPNAPFFGIELEIECKSTNESAKAVGKHLKGKAIATHDGSLANGFEIVFTPHKYQEFRKINLTKVLKELQKTKATSHDKATCGLHIHIEKTDAFCKTITYGRTKFKKYELYKRFYNLLKDDIKKLSKRTDTQISNYCSFERTDKYSAVNLSHSETVEIRIWRGTLNPERFKANLQFTLAVYDFILQHSTSLFFQTYKYSGTPKAIALQQAFHDFLLNSSEYHILKNYCKKHSLFGFTKNLSRPVRQSKSIQEAERQLAIAVYNQLSL